MPSPAPGMWDWSILELLLLISGSSDTNTTPCLLKLVSLTANAIPGWPEISSPLWIPDVIINLKSQFGCYIPNSPELCPGLSHLCFISLRSFWGSRSTDPLGWTCILVASFARIQLREIPGLYSCLASRLSIMALTVEVSNWPISFSNIWNKKQFIWVEEIVRAPNGIA